MNDGEGIVINGEEEKDKDLEFSPNSVSTTKNLDLVVTPKFSKRGMGFAQNEEVNKETKSKVVMPNGETQ